MNAAVNETETAAPRGKLAGLAAAMLLASLGTSIANVALPALVDAFDAPLQHVQWVVLAYLLASTILIVTAGRLGDIAGRRRLLLAGIVLFTAASLLCGLAPSLSLLIAARGLQGAGAAFMMALSVALIGENVPRHKLGSAMGLLGATSAIGTALGPSLGGMLIALFGWRAIFLINLPLGALAAVLVIRCLPQDSPRQPRAASFDTSGTLLLALGLAAYALAMTTGRGHFGLLNLTLLVAATLAAALFVRVESSAPAPLLRLDLFRDPAVATGLAMSALVATVMMATLVVGPFYLSRALLLPMSAVGLLQSVGPLAVALTGVPAGRLTDRLGAPAMTRAGLLAMAAGAAMLSLLPLTFGIPGYVIPLITMTLGYGIFQTANNTAVMANALPDERGLISGMLNLSRNLGLITGASLMAAIFAYATATDLATAPPEAVATGMRSTFTIAAILICVSLAIASIFRTNPSEQFPQRGHRQEQV